MATFSSKPAVAGASLHPMLNIAIKAARAAGGIINRASMDLESLRVARKQANDLVSEVDEAAEKVIIETLLEAYPRHAVLAEESGQTHGNQGSDFVWIIDPLDGTSNYLHGFPMYCTSIALQVAGKLEQAVIYDPVRNDLYTATKGRGAFLNEKRMRVGKRTQLKDCLLTTGLALRPGDNITEHLTLYKLAMQESAGVRRTGSAALDLAFVAAGMSDGYFEKGLAPWDMAAGALLVQEAGGLIGNFTGECENDFLDQRECLAANPRVYAQMVQLLKEFSKYKTA